MCIRDRFNNSKDLKAYPVQMQEDLNLLKTTGCHLAFTPSVEEMYPEGESSISFQLSGLDTMMEGVHRPGHLMEFAP